MTSLGARCQKGFSGTLINKNSDVFFFLYETSGQKLKILRNFGTEKFFWTGLCFGGKRQKKS